MTASATQVHLIAAARMAIGTLAVAPKRTTLANPVGRWLAIHSPLPWPKGMPTAPELQEQRWPKHPGFGQLSARDWGVLIWRHTDHHLRQFSL